MTNSTSTLDSKYIWHPYSTVVNPDPVFPVASAEGVRLVLEDGRSIIDGMSSWWCTIHGYNHPTLNDAAKSQLEKMSHVMFGGLTHEPAAKLSELLVKITPEGLNRVFLADSGSVAMEIAMKMAVQFWYAKKKPEKHKFIALRNAYHGDTFGAMSLSDPQTGMHELFSGILAEQIFIEQPQCKYGTPCEAKDLEDLETVLRQRHNDVAALVVEPIVQGAGGMYFYSADYLAKAKSLCESYDVLLIADEIATGFGRTGSLFACEKANITPDIMALGKSLTGGYMTLSATLTTNHIAETISNEDPGAFMHGPTFMGNPLACAVALASTNLLLDSPWLNRVMAIEKHFTAALSEFSQLEIVKEVRCLGAIGVVELKQPVNMKEIVPMFVEEGIWVRPFGKLVYLMPPFIISEKDLSALTTGLGKVLTELNSKSLNTI